MTLSQINNKSCDLLLTVSKQRDIIIKRLGAGTPERSAKVIEN
ncbi:hypothetical protein DHBDCA_p2030 [Dehalobacter sp. DCA]|nr:hypothetical protein DHBDCA_p2030 [Dehalobacter sp. DCA]